MKLSRCVITLILCCLAVVVFVGCSEESNQVAAQNGPALVIEPNLSVGPIHAGTTAQQIIAQLGEPQRRTPNSLEYTRLGLAVMPDQAGVVQVVMCGDVTGINGPFVKTFTGRTKEGIGMNSTRDEVLKAYGDPTASKKMLGTLESLQYEPLGITFSLEGGKVHHMIVRLRSSNEPQQAVTVDLTQ